MIKNYRNNWPNINHNSRTTKNWSNYKKSIAFTHTHTHTEYVDIRMPRFKNSLIYVVTSPKLWKYDTNHNNKQTPFPKFKNPSISAVIKTKTW